MRRLTPVALVAAVALAATGCLANEDNTGPVAGQEACDTTVTGDYYITTGGTPVAPLVIDGLCVTDGTVIVDADYVTLQNSTLDAAPPTSPYPIFVDDGHHGITVATSILDCDTPTDVPAQAIGILAETPAKHTNPSLEGLYLDVHHNEVRNCTDGFQLASWSRYADNYIHLPADPPGAHADGVQFSTEDDGTPIHDTAFEWNVVEFPDASSSFQYHTNTSDPAGGPYNLVVRYNRFQGGAGVVRVPLYTNGGGNEFYGNHVGRLTENEFFVCTSATGEGTGAIDVWGRETGSTLDSGGDPDILDDDNVNLETGEILQREDCQ